MEKSEYILRNDLRLIKWLSFRKAHYIVKRSVKSCRINGGKKWHQYHSAGNYKQYCIPFNPHIVYKNKGWISWGHWLGTNRKSGGQRKYRVNEHFFKKWSRDMAYILGFWFADGNIKHKRVFSIYQHYNEEYILKRILQKMQSNYPIYRDIRGERGLCGCYINISSKIIYNDLIKLGGLPAKSLIVDFPKIPEKYIASFLRGNFDGDGSVYYDKCNNKYFSCFTSGSKKFIVGIKKHMDKKEIVSKIITQKIGQSIIYYLKLNAHNTKKLGCLLYKNSSNLKIHRKFKLFQEAIRINDRKKFKKCVFLSFRESRNYIRKLQIASYEEWRRKSKKMPFFIPHTPENVYRNEWRGFADWLGYLGGKVYKKRKHNKILTE